MAVNGETLSLDHTEAGIPVIVERMPHSGSAALSVCIGSGSRDEKDDESGIAHLLEHLLFKGTGKRSAREMSEVIEGAGGEMNAYTSREMTVYYATTLDETIATAQELLSEIVLDPSISKNAVETEKNVVTQEIRMLENNPEEYIHILFLNSLWGDHPMGRSEGGTVESVSAMTSSDLRRFYSEHYRPPHFALVACGNVDKEQVRQWAGKMFDDLPPRDTWKNRVAPQPHAGIKVYPREDSQAYVGMGFPGMDVKNQDKYAQRMLSSILGSGTSSRLFQSIREKEGLAYAIYSVAHSFSDCGAFGTFFSTAVENMERVIRLVGEEFRKIRDEGLEKQELIRAKRMLKGVYVRKLESTEARMFRLGDIFLSTGMVMSAEETLEKMDAVTEEDVMRVCHQLIDREKMSMAIHCPAVQGEKAAAELQGLDF